MESILTSIKKLLGIPEGHTEFDPDVIMAINSVFTTLAQLGVGPSKGFFIEDDSAEWTDFIPDLSNYHSIKTYMFYKVKLIFDPNSVGSSTLASYERQIAEFEWRLNVTAESKESTDDIETM